MARCIEKRNVYEYFLLLQGVDLEFFSEHLFQTFFKIDEGTSGNDFFFFQKIKKYISIAPSTEKCMHFLKSNLALIANGFLVVDKVMV